MRMTRFVHSEKMLKAGGSIFLFFVFFLIHKRMQIANNKRDRGANELTQLDRMMREMGVIRKRLFLQQTVKHKIRGKPLRSIFYLTGCILFK